NLLQVNMAPARVNTSRKAVLLTVPFRLMAPASWRTTVPVPRSRKVDSLSAGLPLRMEFARAVGGWPKDTQGAPILAGTWRDARVDTPAPAPDNSRPAAGYSAVW